MILAIILLVAAIALVWWLFNDDQRANQISTFINAASLIYYTIIGLFVLLAILALMSSGKLNYMLFGTIVLVWLLIIARVKMGNTRRALAE